MLLEVKDEKKKKTLNFALAFRLKDIIDSRFASAAEKKNILPLLPHSHTTRILQLLLQERYLATI